MDYLVHITHPFVYRTGQQAPTVNKRYVIDKDDIDDLIVESEEIECKQDADWMRAYLHTIKLRNTYSTVQADGIRALVEAVRCRDSQDDTRTYAAKALANITIKPKYIQQIVDCNAVAPLLVLLKCGTGLGKQMAADVLDSCNSVDNAAKEQIRCVCPSFLVDA